MTADAIVSYRKLVDGTAAGFAEGAAQQNRTVQGYLLAFLSAYHQDRDPWFEPYIMGSEVPGITTSQE